MACIRNGTGWSLGVAILVFALVCLAGPAWADGPNLGFYAPPKHEIHIDVTYEGHPVPDHKFPVAILGRGLVQSKQRPRVSGTNNTALDESAYAASLSDLVFQDASGDDWVCRQEDRGGDSWRVFREERQDKRFPKEFRFAIYLPSQKKLFVTEAVETGEAGNNNFAAKLSSDGTATLTRLPPTTGSPGCAGCVVILGAGIALTLAAVFGGLWLVLRHRQAEEQRLRLLGRSADDVARPPSQQQGPSPRPRKQRRG
jgi:hypothetical protein